MVEVLMNHIFPADTKVQAAGCCIDGVLALEGYGALGDGRPVALSGEDGSIDWWCVSSLDSPPLFDRLLDPEEGGRFVVTSQEPLSAERRYLPNSNAQETVFTTASGPGTDNAVNDQRHCRPSALGRAHRRVEAFERQVRF
jgi:hypothetical protein